MMQCGGVSGIRVLIRYTVKKFEIATSILLGLMRRERLFFAVRIVGDEYIGLLSTAHFLAPVKGRKCVSDLTGRQVIDRLSHNERNRSQRSLPRLAMSEIYVCYIRELYKNQKRSRKR